MTSDNSQPSNAMFSKEEMERRYTKAREMMAQRGLDALLISNEENFQYFTGTTGTIALHYSNTRPAIFILSMEKDPIIVTGKVVSLGLDTSCYVKDLRGYTNIIDFPHEMTLEAIRDAGLKNNRIGVELGQEQRMGMPVGAYLGLVDALPRVQFVDAADIIVSLRMVKSPEEVDYMKQAADITGKSSAEAVRWDYAWHDRARGGPKSPAADPRRGGRQDLFCSS